MRVFVFILLLAVFCNRKLFGDSAKRALVIDDSSLKQFKTNGFLLYTAIPIMFLTGFYRVMNYESFKSLKSVGLSYDLLLNVIPLCVVIFFNSEILKMQSFEKLFENHWVFAVLVSKAVVLLEIVVSSVLVCCQKPRKDFFVCEDTKRKVFAKKYFSLAIFSLVLVTGLSLGSTFAIPNRVCEQKLVYNAIC